MSWTTKLRTRCVFLHTLTHARTHTQYPQRELWMHYGKWWWRWGDELESLRHCQSLSQCPGVSVFLCVCVWINVICIHTYTQIHMCTHIRRLYTRLWDDTYTRLDQDDRYTRLWDGISMFWFHLCGGGRESVNECVCVCVCVEAVVMLVMLDCRHRIKGCASVK
jgi:hypothetical protein